MPTREVVRDYLNRAAAPTRQAMREHYTAQSEVGRRADLIAQDDKYQVWLDHMQALADKAKERATGLKARLSAGEEVGDGLTKLLLQLRDAEGECRGLSIAMGLVPTLIEAGKKAEEMLA